MGNCCVSDGANISAKEAEPALRKVKYVDGQGHSSTAAKHSQGEAQLRPVGPAAINQPAAQEGIQQSYALDESMRYSKDASGVYYQPKGPLHFMDPVADAPPVENGERTAAVEAASEAPTTLQTDITTWVPPPDTTTNTTITSSTTTTDTTITTNTVVNSANVTSITVTSTSKAKEVTPSTLRQQSSYEPRDVMISYSRTDIEIMQKIKEQLEALGVTVWVDVASVDAGTDFLSKIGEAIIDAKLFVCILSEKAVKSKYCRDEVALAYVSNTAIYPVNLLPREDLLPLMDTGLKLQLANYNWTSLTEPHTLNENIHTLVLTMKAELDDVLELTGGDALSFPPSPTSPVTADPADVKEEVTSAAAEDVVVDVDRDQGSGGSPTKSPDSDRAQPPEFNPLTIRLRERNRAAMTSSNDDVSHVMPDQFWSDRFGVSDFVTWDRFTSAFLEAFKEPVENVFTGEDQQQLMDILKRELEVDTDERIYKYQLMTFCSIHGETSPVWQRVYEQARESFAMREVFNMDSSVRVEAIENLGKFRSAAVIDALRDLLTDPDANVRAVATVSLSRTNANDPVTIRHITRTLNDQDRLVREAGCLALGHLKARQAVSKLTHLWRNDVISHVRDAAAVALRQIGGQEVEDVMRVTKVLAEEIRTLTEMES